MLYARSAGVAFSVHPVISKRDRIVIEGSWGLGEAFVQGLVEPDHIEVDKVGEDDSGFCSLLERRDRSIEPVLIAFGVNRVG